MPDHPEDDPTGVRRMLSDLPDPAPPSADLLHRIGRSLEELDHPGEPLRFDPATSRGRGRPSLVAAVLALGTALVASAMVVAPFLPSRLHQAQAAFRLDGMPGPATPVATPVAAPVESPAPTASTPGTTLAPFVVSTGTSYHRGALSRQVEAVLASQRPSWPADAPPGAPRPGGLSIEDVRSCLHALTGRGREFVDVATFGSRPALVVVRENADATTVTVLPASCASDSTATPLAGPYRLR